jgi:hypothetical protein
MSRSTRGVLVLVAACCGLGSAVASAQPPPAYYHLLAPPGPCDPGAPPDLAWRCRPPRHLAITVAFLKEYGFGGGLRGRFNHVGFEAVGAYMPYLVIGGEFHYFTTFQATGALLIFFNGHQRPTQHGIKLGFAYNNLSRYGFLIGYAAEWSKSPHFAWSFGGGIQVFPQAADRIEDELRKETTGSVKVDSLAALQFYIGISLHFYLL